MARKSLRGNIADKGGFWLNWPNKILGVERPGWSDFTWGMVSEEKPVRNGRVVG